VAPGAAAPASRASDGRLLVFFATVYAVLGLAGPETGLASQPGFFLLEEQMGPGRCRRLVLRIRIPAPLDGVASAPR